MRLIDRDRVRRYLFLVSCVYTAFHLLLVPFFFRQNISLMAWINLIAALACGGSFVFLSRGMFSAHMLAIYSAHLLQLVFAVYCLGWGSGFQIPLMGLTLLVFLGEYLGRTLNYRYLKSLPVGIVSLAVYLLILGFRFRSPGLLPLPDRMTLVLQVIWSLLSFALCLAGLYCMVRMTAYSEKALSDQASTDQLTGLLNRAGYEQILTHVDLHTTTFVLIDGDKFKLVNDKYGHETGDRVLKKIAKSLRQNFRLGDCVCRIGGDEFAVLMLNTDSLQKEQILHKISRVNRELSHTEDKLPTASVSVGVAFGGEENDWLSLFKHADEALYLVKQEGGRGCRFYGDN